MIRTTFFWRILFFVIIAASYGSDTQAYDRGFVRHSMGDGALNFYQIEKAEQKLTACQRELARLKRDLIRLEGMLGQPRITAALRAQIQALLEAIDCADVDDLRAKIAQKEKFEEGLSERLNKIASGKQTVTSVQMFSRGLMGNDFGYFDDEEIKDFWTALNNGFLYAVSKEMGEFLRTKMRGVLQDKLGVLFDGLVNSISDSCSRVQEVIFHDGYRPFEEDKLVAWQAFVNNIFSDVEKAVKDYLKSASSGQDMTMRNASALGDDFDGAAPLVPTSEEQQKLQAFEHVWPDLFSGHVMRLAFFSSMLEDRKGYYESDSEVVFFASQIQLSIKQFSQLLLCVSSAADVDNYLGPTRPALPYLRSSIDNLFKMLQLYTKRRTFNTTATTQLSMFDREKSTRAKDRAFDNDFDPQSAWAR